MKYIKSSLKDAFLIEPELLKDNRGFFTRTYCEEDFMKHGMDIKFVQCNVSHNDKAQTLRGIHFQKLHMKKINILLVLMEKFKMLLLIYARILQLI